MKFRLDTLARNGDTQVMPKRSSINKGRTAGPIKEKDPLAVELGRRGGLKGGRARALKLSAPMRTEIAKKAAQARWKKKESL